MECFTVHTANDFLVLSMNSLPGFGKLCTAKINSNGTIVGMPVYFAGGFFKREYSPEDLAYVINDVRKLVLSRAQKRNISGHILELRFTTCLESLSFTFNYPKLKRKVVEHEHPL